MSTNFKTIFNIIQDYANNLIIINATSIIINANYHKISLQRRKYTMIK